MLGSEQIGNGMERNPRRRGLERGKHGGGSQRAEAVLVIQLTHGFEQPCPALLAVQRIEEVQRVESIRNQTVQLHADEVGMLIVLAGRAGLTKGAERGDE